MALNACHEPNSTSLQASDCEFAQWSFVESCQKITEAVVQGSSGDKDDAKDYMQEVCSTPEMQHLRRRADLLHVILRVILVATAPLHDCLRDLLAALDEAPLRELAITSLETRRIRLMAGVQCHRLGHPLALHVSQSLGYDLGL